MLNQRALSFLICFGLSSFVRSEVIFYSENIASDTTWSASDIHVIESSITVNSGVTLTIEAGAYIKSKASGYLNVEGVLVADGVQASPIVFTSYQDDSVGGDTNGDGEASQGVPGQWRGIRFGQNVTESQTKFSYVHVQNAGNNNYSAIELYRNGVVIENSVIRNNQDAGIYLNEDGTNVLRNNQIQNNNYGIYASGNYGISALIEGNTLEDNRTDGIYFRYTVTAQVKDNVIRNNGRWGLYWDRNNSAPIIMGNTITGNALGVRLPASAVPNPSDGNTLTPNTRNAVWIIGGTRSTDLILPLMNAGQADELSQYRVEGQLLMNTGTTLTVQPGVILKFADNAQLYMHGTLVADGTEEQPIIFTDYRDDRWGGDLNADGLSTGLAGAWQGIEFSGNTTESNVLDHIQVHYAGRNVAGIYANSNKPLTVSHSLVSNSGNEGIRVRNTDLTLTNVDLIGNGSHGLRLHYGTHQLSMQGGRVFANGGWGAYFSDAFGGDVEGVEFFANGSGAITNRGSAQVDARGNWWGALDGPSGDEAGSGDAVSNTSSGSLTVSDLFKGVLADGTPYTYLNAGPNITHGTLASVQVLAGTETAEWGSTPRTSALFDMDAVHLLLSGLDSSKRYQLYVVYLNKDNASAVGGSRQQLVTDDGVVVHSALTAPTSKPGLFSFSLPQSSYQDGTITLQLERMSGYRVALSELLLIELTSEDADAPEVSVQSPAEGAYLNGSHVVVSGTSSDNIAVEDRWLTIQSNESSTQYAMSSVQSDGNWQFNWPLPEDGIYQLSAGARDASGHRGYSDQLTVQVDNTAPTAVRYVTVYDTPADAGSSITLTWPASSDAGSGVAGYRITRRLASGGSVQTLGTVSADLNTYQDASAVTGTEYIYTVTTEDKAGNQSTAIDSSTIAAIDNSLEDIIAPEEVTNFTAVASNESVRLTWTASQNSANDLISQWLDYSTDGGANWSTVEALDVSLTQYQFSNLQNDTAYRFRLRMVDAANPANVSAGVISDTVTPSETAYIEVSGTFSEDIDWLAGTYRVTGDVVVPAGITLTVHPNAIIKFNADRKLTVNGVLNVVGSSGNEAVFTSWQDDEYGGDTNGDGASQGQAGDWRHIALIDGEANIDYAIIRFAGQDASVDEALYAYQSPLSLTHSTIEYSGDRAIKVSEDRSGQSLSATLIDHNTLRHNYRSAIYLYHRYGSSTDPAEITNNQIEDNDNTAAIDLQNVNAKIQAIRSAITKGTVFTSRALPPLIAQRISEIMYSITTNLTCVCPLRPSRVMTLTTDLKTVVLITFGF